MRPFVLILLLAVLALPSGAARAGDGGTAPDPTLDAGVGAMVPKVAVPSLDLGDLGVPSAGGLSADRPAAPQATGPTKVTFAAGDLRLARRFAVAAGGGCSARGALQGFRLDGFPGTVTPFETCLRLSASAGVVAHLEARILDPSGHDVADADGEVSFAHAGKTQDFVIAWRGFPARHPGTYRLEVTLGGRDAGHFPIVVAGTHR
jgi:hypothetical protein